MFDMNVSTACLPLDGFIPAHRIVTVMAMKSARAQWSLVAIALLIPQSAIHSYMVRLHGHTTNVWADSSV